MDTRIVARLAEIMGQHNLSELEVEEQGLRIHLHRNDATLQEPAAAAPADSPDAIAKTAEAPKDAAEPAVDTSLATITSPLVGTFYTSASPDAEPFVREGSAVKAGMTVCIIEAMKVMNEVKAEQSGIVSKILVGDKSAVEYGTPLFEIKVD